MARGINKVILVGNLGADPETRYTAGGAAVSNIRLATTDSWKDRESGEKQERDPGERREHISALGPERLDPLKEIAAAALIVA